jgi:hypothetical protein
MQNTSTLAYLSFGEVSSDTLAGVHASWIFRDPITDQIVRNKRWQTLKINMLSESWQKWLVETRIPQLLSIGVHGLFLDNVEVIDAYKFMRPGVESAIHKIRNTYPDILLLTNRGFDTLHAIVSSIDAVVFESFTSYHNGHKYQIWSEAELDWTDKMAKKIRSLAPENPILTVDYANPDDSELREIVNRRSESHGYIPFVTTFSLDWLPSQ